MALSLRDSQKDASLLYSEDGFLMRSTHLEENMTGNLGVAICLVAQIAAELRQLVLQGFSVAYFQYSKLPIGC